MHLLPLTTSCASSRALDAHKQRSLGFTLVELMVVVALLAVVAAIALPNFTPTIQRNNITSQMNDLIGALNLARVTAMQRGLPVTVCRAVNDISTAPDCHSSSYLGRNSNDWATGWIVIVEADPAGTLGTLDTGDELIKRYEARSSTYFIAKADATQRITYNAQGLLAGNTNATRFGFSGSLTGSDYDDINRSLCITRGGRIRSVPSSASNACADF